MITSSHDDKRITYFGETDARSRRVKFGIKAIDRTKHVYVIGKTGMGKSTLLENMAAQDIQNGEGLCFIDPHGKSADLLLEYVPKNRIRDVIYIAPFDVAHPISFNVLESVDPTKRHLVVAGLMSTFKKIWVDAWSARMEYILTNTLLALLEAPGTTLLGVNRMLSDKAYRKEIVSHVTDPGVKSFWVNEFANYTERMAAESVPAIQNKVGQFTANPLIRNMIGQPVSSFSFREAMDSRKIMIINLSKGKIGDDNMKLLGGLLVTKIYLAAMSRADIPDRVMKIMPNFYLFVDEFQNFANASFADILSEARKYKLNLTIAHQYVEQMDEIVRPAVFGNVGTMIVFRIGATDAEALEKEFAPQFTMEDLVNLGQYQMYLKLMIDGLTSPPFSGTNLPPIIHPDTTYVTDIIAASREQFAKPQAEVEEGIMKFHEPTPPPKPAANPKFETLNPKQASNPNPEIRNSPAPVPLRPIAPVSPKAAPAPVAAPIPVAAKPPAQPVHQPFKNALTDLLKAAATPKPKPVPPPAPIAAPAPQPAPVAPPAPVSPSAPKPVPPPQPKPVAPMPIPKPVAPAPLTASKPIVPAPKPQTQTAAVIQPSIKPVSLSSLAPKPAQQKVDPKVPSKQNVDSLKNALAAAMKKAQPAAPKQEAPQPKPVSAPIPAANPAPQIPTPPPVAPTNTAPEVPEDVLKNVLKVD